MWLSGLEDLVVSKVRWSGLPASSPLHGTEAVLSSRNASNS
jgi:hypothetical protein